MKEDKEEFERRLLNKAINEKGLRWRRKQLENIFNMYCGDLKVWVVKLAEWVKKENRIGLHPFLIEGSYKDRKDKIVATLMSALIPKEEVLMMKRMGVMKKLLGDSPALFIAGGYKIKDYSQYRSGLGCDRGRLQAWVEILKRVMLGPEEMVLNNLDYYIAESGFEVNRDMKDSLEEAKFWLAERVMGEREEDIKVPDIVEVREMIRAWVPRYKSLGWDKSVELLGFEYKAEAWYAAMGREWLYKTHYDEIYRMEQNLAAKVSNGTRMRYLERWRFRTNFIKPLEIIISN